jgi:hypothetical protein
MKRRPMLWSAFAIVGLMVISVATVIAGSASPGLSGTSGSRLEDRSRPGPTSTPRPTSTTQPTPTATATPTGQPTPTPGPNALQITTVSMPNGNVGTFYGNFITSSGGQGTPHTFKLLAGRMPAGLTMATDFGVNSTSVTGTPTTVETQTFTVQVRDQSGNTATKVLSITIDPPRTLVITNQSGTLAPGTRGSSYATSLFADGGIQPYTWSIIAGQLPPGLNLSGNRIQGTTTTAGTFTFIARVRDSGGQEASRQFSITVT